MGGSFGGHEQGTGNHQMYEDDPAKGEITALLLAWNAGDESAFQRLMELLYENLRLLARATLTKERPDHTLQATALVHEAYLRLVNQKQVTWQNRSQFLCLAARQIRRVLLDYARQRSAAKRGGEDQRVPVEMALDISEERTEAVFAVDRALEQLAALDPELADLVELRFFGGLTQEEIAAVRGLSLSTVARRWKVAKARLVQLLEDGSHDP